MQRKKILWLVSWYPNKNDAFDGDFIQRHARAAAINHDVHVIFVTEAAVDDVESEITRSTGLIEECIYFRKKSGILGRLKKQMMWRKLYVQAVERYLSSNGKPDHVHVHVPWKAGWIALWLKRKHGLDYLVTEHWGIYNHIVKDNFLNKPVYFQRLLKKIFAEAKKFISVSEYLVKGINEMVVKKKHVIIPNVVDTSLFFFKKEKYSVFTYIHVSNMVPLKNVKGILDAFYALSQKTENVQLILVGNRDREYVNYAAQLGLLNRIVYFRGEIAYREVAKEMQSAHILIQNSNIENAPCVISEAVCCGLPVISTRVGGIPEMINSSNGMLINSSDAAALCEAMLRMKEGYHNYDPSSIAVEASAKFGYAAIAGCFNQLYESK
jgi:glycosyltransferase involved in cell wall biosynthesis